MTLLTPNRHSHSDDKRNFAHQLAPTRASPYFTMDQDGVPPPPMNPASACVKPISSHPKQFGDQSPRNSPLTPSRVPLRDTPGRLVNKPQHQASRASMTNISDSPATVDTSYSQPDRTKTYGRSLAGFDPLLGGQSVLRPAPQTEAPPPSHHLDSVEAPYMQAAAPTKFAVLQLQLTAKDVPSKHQQREGQPTSSGDVRGAPQRAPDKEVPQEQRSTSQERSSNVDNSERVPATPKRSSAVDICTQQDSPAAKKGTGRRDLFTISIPSRRDVSSASVSPKGTRSGAGGRKVRDENTGTPNGISRKLPWARGRSSKRAQSLEMNENPSKTKREPRSNSVDENKESTETRTSMYNSIVKDLMELSFDKLQLPTLAKPLPTSFLTGRESEVMRTCEYEAAPFQMEIPSLAEVVVPARLNEFVENYRRIDQNFDLEDWKGMTNAELRQVKMVQHIPIAQLLLECGDDVSIQGVVAVGSNADNRVEAIIFESQQHFTVVIRGTTEQQSKPCSKKTMNRKAVSIDAEHANVEVYQSFLDEYQKIEKKCFALLDKLAEEHPFCDVVFTGHSFGGALSTLAAVRYANARPMMRVKCYPMASPKVGFSEFRNMVNSSPNLRVVRLEYGQDGKCQLPGPGGSHVGHTLVVHGSLGINSLRTKEPVLIYKFNAPKNKKFKTTYPDLRSYVVALEEITRLHLPWAKDYVGLSGEGVVVNNEPRQMV